MPGTLYLVATPIGNLQDISFRAIATLKAVDVIACEDTRHTRKLLTHYDISNRLISYHEQNEYARADELAEMLAEGKSVAVVSDAGTPGICDPGFRIVEKARSIGAAVISIPGPAAFVAAVTASGLATDSIFFGGFLPSKQSDRRKRLEEVREIPATLVFYEAPHRLIKCLDDCRLVLGDRRAAVARELTKLHEETFRGTLTEIFNHFSEGRVKGEFVIMIERATAAPHVRELTPENLMAYIQQLESSGLDRKSALKQAAKDFGLSKSSAYTIVQSLRK